MAVWLVFVYLWLPYMILPIYAGLERIPSSLLEASADLGGRGWVTFRRVILPLSIPAVAAGSIFTFSLTLGDYIVPGLVSTTQFIGNVIYINVAQDLPLAAAYSLVPLGDHAALPVRRPASRRLRGALMPTGLGRIALRVATGLVLAFIYVPLLLVVIYAFNASGTSAWPPSGFTLEWVRLARREHGPPAGLPDVDRRRHRGDGHRAGASAAWPRWRSPATPSSAAEAISFVVILPIALPGIVTGMALSTTFASFGFPLGMLTVIIGHATFCVVLVFNNAIARLRRTSRSFEEASADLGADTFQTFRFVTFPALRSALLAGALLAFALSFDEVIVTIFTAGGVKTLPIWIFQSFRLANQVPLVNVAGLAAILLSVIPVYIATRVSSGVAIAK